MVIDAEQLFLSDRTAVHELMHGILSASESSLPLWLEEGLAEYFSTAQIRGGVLTLGAPIPEHRQRVRQVMSELEGEKIDIVDYSDDPAEMIAHALSPARVSQVLIVDPVAKAARVIVPDYQLSLAIGREGQNARLAARLTGWRIDIRSDAAGDPAGQPA